HRRVITVEEFEQVRDETVVVVPFDGADARGRALLDVGVQARATETMMPVELRLCARPDRERAQQEVERLADGVRVGERPVVPDSLSLGASHDHRPGPLLVERDGEERVGLVVLEADVEARLVALDEIEREEEGHDLVADLDPFDRLGHGHHLPGPLRQRGRRTEVVGEPTAQALGLPHVDHAALGVLEQVGPRAGGDGAGLRTVDHVPILLRPTLWQKESANWHCCQTGARGGGGRCDPSRTRSSSWRSTASSSSTSRGPWRCFGPRPASGPRPPTGRRSRRRAADRSVRRAECPSPPTCRWRISPGRGGGATPWWSWAARAPGPW